MATLKHDYRVSAGDTAAHNLLTVIFAADSGFIDIPAYELNLTADSANTGTIYFGSDNTVSATAYGISLVAGQSHTFRTPNKDTANRHWFKQSVAGDNLAFERII